MITEQALSNRRKYLLVGTLCLGTLPVLSSVADLLQLIDTMSSTDNPTLTFVTCASLIVIPLIAAGIYFLPQNRAIFLFCALGLSMATLGSLYGGMAVERAGTELPGSANASPEDDRRCEAKIYNDDPDVLQTCRRVPLVEGRMVDLDDPAARALSKPRKPDLELSGGSLYPKPDVTLAVLTNAVISNARYPISYAGCREAKRGTTPISLQDLTQRMAVCVETGDGRIAILWLIDYDYDQQSAILTVRCWRQAPG